MRKPATEAVLLEAIRKRALCTRENGKLPAKTSHGRNLDWMLDIRRLFLNSDDLELVTEVFWEYMADRLPFQVGGLETGAIPLVSAILVKGRQKGYDVNGFFVRKSRKKAGLKRQIEGELNDQPIVVVDDLVNSGGSMKRVISALAQEHRSVRDAFTYVNFKSESAIKLLRDEDIALHSVFTLADLGVEKKPKASPYPDQETLEVAWVFSPPDPNYIFVVPMSTPALDEKKAYYGADNGFFYAVNQDDGTKAWEFETGESLKGILSSPVIHGAGVIFGAYDGTVYNLDRSDGSILWRYDAADHVGSSPALAPDLGLLYIGLEQNVHQNQGSIVALDLDTGDRIWEHVMREYLHGTPVYSPEEGIVCVGTNDSTVVCLDAESGELHWEFRMEGPIKAGVTMDLVRHQVIAPSFDWNCYGIDVDTGEGKILFTGNHAFYNTALVADDRLFVGSCGKRMYTYDLAEESLISSLQTQGRIMSHPALIEGRVVFGCNDGCIREIDLDGNMTGGIYLPERSLSQVRYRPETGRYFVVTAGNHLVALQRLTS